jgi:hypothetical protein
LRRWGRAALRIQIETPTSIGGGGSVFLWNRQAISGHHRAVSYIDKDLKRQRIITVGQQVHTRDLQLPESVGVIHENRCNICKSASRARIDRLIAAGMGDKELATELLALEPEFKGKKLDTVRKNVERHRKNHINIKDRAVRKILEKRALDQGMLIDEVEGSIVTYRGMLDLAIQRAVEQFSDPNAKIRFADAIDAAKLLEEIERSTFAEQVEIMQRQVQAISLAVKEELGEDEDRLRRIGQRAKEYFDNPAMETQRKTVTVVPKVHPVVEHKQIEANG